MGMGPVPEGEQALLCLGARAGGGASTLAGAYIPAAQNNTAQQRTISVPATRPDLHGNIVACKRNVPPPLRPQVAQCAAGHLQGMDAPVWSAFGVPQSGRAVGGTWARAAQVGCSGREAPTDIVQQPTCMLSIPMLLSTHRDVVESGPTQDAHCTPPSRRSMTL